MDINEIITEFFNSAEKRTAHFSMCTDDWWCNCPEGILVNQDNRSILFDIIERNLDKP